jgi:hypothetical protein
MPRRIEGFESRDLYLAQVDQNLKDLLKRTTLRRQDFAERIELLQQLSISPGQQYASLAAISRCGRGRFHHRSIRREGGTSASDSHRRM